MYRLEAKSVVQRFNELTHKNADVISQKYSTRVEGIESLIDIQCKIASNFVGLWNAPGKARRGHRELMPLLFSLFHKNFFIFYSALKLTIQGLYGPARPLIRNLFESLMIAKFCHISDNANVMKKWDSGETIYFTNSVLKKIINPNPKHFFDFWGLVCEHSHATKSSMQFDLELDNEDETYGILANLALLASLLECNYHLLNSHLITPQLTYMVKFIITRYASENERYEIPELRNAAHLQFKKNRKFLGPDSVSLIWAYKRKWILRT